MVGYGVVGEGVGEVDRRVAVRGRGFWRGGEVFGFFGDALGVWVGPVFCRGFEGVWGFLGLGVLLWVEL